MLEQCQWYPDTLILHSTVVDPDLELRRGPSFISLAKPAFLPLVISFIFTQNNGGGGGGQAPPLDLPLLKLVSPNNNYNHLQLVSSYISCSDFLFARAKIQPSSYSVLFTFPGLKITVHFVRRMASDSNSQQ